MFQSTNFACDNLVNSNAAKSKTRMVSNGANRDMDEIYEILNFNTFARFWNLEGMVDVTLKEINTPIRIGSVTVIPGDVVLGRLERVIFIPPHLAEEVVKTSEIVRVRDMFGHQCLHERKYTPGEIDRRWSDDMGKDFSQWLNDHIDELPVPKEQIREYLKIRTW